MVHLLENCDSRWRGIRPAWILALLILLGWIIGLIGDAVNVCPPLVGVCENATTDLAQDNAIVIYGHEYFQMFTSILVTDSPLDALFNAIAVLILDRLTEDSLNKTRYFAIFFGTALFGNVLTLLEGSNYASAGASGGIFGIFASLVAFSWLRDKRPDVPPLVFFLIIFIGSSILPDVNYVAHIGGAIGGFIAAALLYGSVRHSVTEYTFAYDSEPMTVVITTVLIFLSLVASIVQFLLFAGV